MSRWYYLDPQREWQGPFDAETLVGWRQDGWFDEKCYVAREGSSVSVLLGSVPELSLQSEKRHVVPSSETVDDPLTDALASLSLESGFKSSDLSPPSCVIAAQSPPALSETRGHGRLDDTSNRKQHSVAKTTKTNLVKGAASGQAAWKSFQKKQESVRNKTLARSNDADKKGLDNKYLGVDGTLDDEQHSAEQRKALSFKIRPKSKATQNKLKSGMHPSPPPAPALVASQGAQAPPSNRQSSRTQKLTRLVVIDTCSWIDAAAEVEQSRSGDGLARRLMQNLITTQILVVVPEQVIRELDALKNQRECGGGSKRGTRFGSNGFCASSETTPKNSTTPLDAPGEQQKLTPTAQRARMCSNFIRDAIIHASTSPGGAGNREGEVASAPPRQPSRALCSQQASTPEASSIPPTTPLVVTMALPSFLVKQTDAEAASEFSTLAGGSQRQMTGDYRILASALACNKQQSHEVFLVTADTNLQLLAQFHGVCSGTMGTLQAELAEREAAWRRAYATEAIGQAQCMGAKTAPPVL